MVYAAVSFIGNRCVFANTFTTFFHFRSGKPVGLYLFVFLWVCCIKSPTDLFLLLSMSSGHCYKDRSNSVSEVFKYDLNKTCKKCIPVAITEGWYCWHTACHMTFGWVDVHHEDCVKRKTFFKCFLWVTYRDPSGIQMNFSQWSHLASCQFTCHSKSELSPGWHITYIFL